MDKTIKEKVLELVENGIVEDIFKAERGYAMFKTIGEHVDRINKSEYARFFGTAQSAYREQFLIATARLFDQPSTRHPTRCIAGLLNFLENNIDQLPVILERANLRDTMLAVGFSQAHADLVRNNSDSEINNAIITHYKILLSTHQIKDSLGKLKTLRNKRLAHNEIGFAELVTPTFKELLDLIEQAKGLMGVIGWAYLNTIYMFNGGHYHFSEDAVSPKYALINLLDDLDKFKDQLDEK